MNDFELAHRIFDVMSDGYDDEEQRESVVEELVAELQSLGEQGALRKCFIVLCERIEELCI